MSRRHRNRTAWDTGESVVANASAAGEILRGLHSRSNTSGRLEFVNAIMSLIDSDKMEESTWEAFIEGCLQQTCLGILLEERLYRNFLAEKRTTVRLLAGLFMFVDRIDTYWQDYIIAVGNVLKSILIHLIQTLPRDDLDPCERPPWAVYVLDRLPQLWSIIVNHPRVTTFDVAYHENGHKGAAPFLQLRDMMSDLLTLYTALYPPQR